MPEVKSGSLLIIKDQYHEQKFIPGFWNSKECFIRNNHISDFQIIQLNPWGKPYRPGYTTINEYWISAFFFIA